jgi:ABC-type transporter Mla MlaB component
MLRITIHDRSRELRMKLEGKLSGPWVAELRQCWLTASSTTAGRATSVDLGEVDFVDAEGQTLLADMIEQGVRLDAATPLIQALLDAGPGRMVCAAAEAAPVGASHRFHFRGRATDR